MKRQLFTPEYIEKIETHLQERIKMQKYLDSNCCLSKISDESNIPAHHLTYYFNAIKETSFSDWRNALRIAHAKELFSQGKSETFTLESISLQSGFVTQNTFIRAFKNSTGKTPSNYLKSLS
jgi:AraC-like DNA-binding protein